MDVIKNDTRAERRKKRLQRRLRLLVGTLTLSLAAFIYTSTASLIPPTNNPEILETALSPAGGELQTLICTLASDPIPAPDNIFTRDIISGDTLGSIFKMFGITPCTLQQILAADEEMLALDTLRPGNRLTFTFDKEVRTLERMELFIHPARQVVYQRLDDATFGFDEVVLPGTWEQDVLEGSIDGSFYLSAKRAGLSEKETAIISDLFSDQINFAREIRAGDVFQIIRSQQLVEDEFTGQSRIEGVRIFRGKRLYSAFLFEDGNYYDQQGESLARAFRRYPMNGQHRVSSAFNPRRLHPITRRVSPHNGVDFAMPSGTPVLATGDGIVTRVQNHPYAGKYIEIQHGSHYTTRYLHLSRFLVKTGQKVERGQRIAQSGNTGRSTGPHLHFELHIKGRPANPLTASIPKASSVPQGKLAEFNQRVNQLVSIMEQPQLHIAQPEPVSAPQKHLTGQTQRSQTQLTPAS
ncbi:MAG: peptidoglycan DD-metalloendopeptidase family protein [Desulfuromonadaceae bacterium]|nr:peptidoglycan DD-metalloendopeptidase family protein [Desulfuromonadaceae bacterium]